MRPRLSPFLSVGPRAFRCPPVAQACTTVPQSAVFTSNQCSPNTTTIPAQPLEPLTQACTTTCLLLKYVNSAGVGTQSTSQLFL